MRINLAEIQRIETEALVEIADICDAVGIDYFLAYGTALGAIRHHGPIPWDSDVDVCIPYHQLDLFFKEVPMRLSEKFYVDYYKLDPKSSSTHPDIFARGIDGRVCHVDVFPYVSLPDDAKESEEYLASLRDCMMKIWYKRFGYIGNHGDYSPKMLIKRIIHYLKCVIMHFRLPSIEKLSSELEEKMGRYKPDECAYWIVPADSDIERISPKRWLSTKIEVNYNGYKLKILEQYDEYLTHYYGDYMTPVNRDITGSQSTALVKKKVYERYHLKN